MRGVPADDLDQQVTTGRERFGVSANDRAHSADLVLSPQFLIGGTVLTRGVGDVVGSLALAALWMIITKDGSIKPEYLTIITGGILLIFVLLQRALTKRRKT